MKKINPLMFLIFAGLFLLQNPLAAQAKKYAVGDKGPGGGYIFWVKPAFSDGWQYLEAAPEDQGLAEWGCYARIIPGASKRDFAEGRQNTEAILKACPGTTAAKAASSYRGGGKTDWYLPAIEELNRITISLERFGVLNFENAYYWTSSQESDEGDGAYKAFIKHQGYHLVITGNKNSRARVRAVRAF